MKRFFLSVWWVYAAITTAPIFISEWNKHDPLGLLSGLMLANSIVFAVDNLALWIRERGHDSH